MNNCTIDKNIFIKELKEYFNPDAKRISHAMTVLKYAELIMNTESGNPDVIIPTAILHDIGIKEAERKYNSSAGKYQGIEGPPIAREIMGKLNIDNNVIDEVCDIITHHHTPNAIKTLNFNIIWDADLITNITEEGITVDKKKIDKIFKTDEGRKIAEKELLKGEIK